MEVEVDTLMTVLVVCACAVVLVFMNVVDSAAVLAVEIPTPVLVPLATALPVAEEADSPPDEDPLPDAEPPFDCPLLPPALLAKSLPRAIFCDLFPPPL
jgi:hypothetical protein